MFKYKQTKIRDKDYNTKLLVSTVKADQGYETRILKAYDGVGVFVNVASPIAETVSKTWLGSRIDHALFIVQAEKMIDHN